MKRQQFSKKRRLNIIQIENLQRFFLHFYGDEFHVFLLRAGAGGLAGCDSEDARGSGLGHQHPAPWTRVSPGHHHAL